MITINGFYFDGHKPEQTAVRVHFYASGAVHIQGDGVDFKTAVDQIKIAARLADTRRNIYLPGGGKLELEDNAAVDRVCVRFGQHRFQALLHRLERQGMSVVSAVIVTTVFIWAGIEYAVPLTAKWAAKSVSIQFEKDMGAQGLDNLDTWLFSNTTLAGSVQKRLRSSLDRLLDEEKNQYSYHLLFRYSERMGANALALPGGFLIVTDGLVELSENDEQIIAVLAHEIGHVENQHGLRTLFQDSITALFLAVFVGDATSLSVMIPTILLETRYSREFELEADQYAVELLQAHKVPLTRFSRILFLLDQKPSDKNDFDFLSSHPAMRKRISIIRDLQSLQ